MTDRHVKLNVLDERKREATTDLPIMLDLLDKDKIGADAVGLSAKLDRVQWRVNCMCDVRCSFCYGEDELHEVRPEVALPVLDKMIAHGISTFVITGGEALLSKRIDRIMRHLRSKGVKIVLFTNCQYWDFHEEVLEECVDTICVPIEGASEYVHDSVRGKDNLRAVQAVLDRYALKDGPFKVRVGTVIGRHNLNELEAILYLLERYKIEAWTLYKYVRYTDRVLQKHFKTSQLDVSVAEYDAAVQRVSKTPDRKTRIELFSEQERGKETIMINPELEVAIPVRDESGAVTDRVLCSATDRSMSEIQEIWGRSLDWSRYRESLKLSL